MIKETDKIKPISFFTKGSLTFKDSNHTLVKNGKYYRCSLKTNGFCIKKSEELVDIKNMEDRLSRLLEKFMLPDQISVPLFEKIMSIYIKNLMQSGNKEMHIQNNLEATGNLIISNLKEGREIQKSDLLEFKRIFFQSTKNFYSEILLGYLVQFLFILVKNKSEQSEMSSQLDKLFKQKPQKINHFFALQLKKIYISDKGKIENIEFEGFAWYIFQYFKKSIPEYKPKIEEGFILNTKKFKTLDYNEVLEEFIQNDLLDTYSYNPFATKYAKEKFLKKVFGGFEELPMQEKINYLIKLNSPTKESIFAILTTLVRN